MNALPLVLSAWTFGLALLGFGLLVYMAVAMIRHQAWMDGYRTASKASQAQLDTQLDRNAVLLDSSTRLLATPTDNGNRFVIVVGSNLERWQR